jgi:hypothetical protein
MPRLVRPQHDGEARPPRRRPAFAKIDAWEAVQAVQRLGAPSLGLALTGFTGDAPLLETLRARLPAFLQPRSVPDRSRLSSVESFFRYTEEEGAKRSRAPFLHACSRASPAGKRFFEELDQDNDGRVRLEDLRQCMRCGVGSAAHARLVRGTRRSIC